MSSQHNRFGPPEAYGQPPRTGRFWFDLLAAMAAIFISVVSLVVAIRGERTQRELLAANSWPFLQLSEDQTAEEVKLDVENAGVGPARIFSFEVFYKGQPVGNALDLLHQCCGTAAPAPGADRAGFSGFGYGTVYGNALRPGEHILAMKILRTTSRQDVLARFTASLPDLSFRGCYCSVLGECWMADMQSLNQRAVRSCPVAPYQFSYGTKPS